MRLLVVLAIRLMMSPPALATCGDQEPILRHLKLSVWPGLYREQDVEGLRAFLAPGFRSVAADGSVTTREEELRWLAANPGQPQDFSYTITSLDRPVPGVALIIGTGRSVRTDPEGKRRTNRAMCPRTCLSAKG